MATSRWTRTATCVATARIAAHLRRPRRLPPALLDGWRDIDRRCRHGPATTAALPARADPASAYMAAGRSAANITAAAGPMSARRSGWHELDRNSPPEVVGAPLGANAVSVANRAQGRSLAERLPQERHGDAPLRRQRGAVEPVEQRGQSSQVAADAPEQPIQRRVVQHQAAPLRALRSTSRRPSSSSGASVMRVHCPRRERRSGSASARASGMSRAA